METNIPDPEIASNRKSRTSWFLISVIILLCIVTFVQGIILLRMKTERGGQAWQERLQKVLPGLANQSRQAALNPPDNQVVFWETADDLEQIHDQINQLLRDMNPPFGADIAAGPFPGIAKQRENAKRPPSMPAPGRDINQLQREIERIFTAAYNDNRQSTVLSRFNRGWDMVPSTAAMNIEDQGTNYMVTVALPGYDKQGIKITLEGRLLIIDAAQTAHTQASPIRAHANQFHTQIMMPENIKNTGVQAAYEQDVLCVHIPKESETNSLVRPIAIR